MNGTDQIRPHPWLGRVWEQFFIDRRALVAFRIGVGIMILVDLFNRSRLLSVHYTDDGILPRGDVVAAQGAFDYSFHLLSGEGWVVALLFLINALLALAFIVGFRTRLVTVLLWLFMVSLHSRAPGLLQAGDILLRLYLLWGIFLPLGVGWSVDRALDSSETPPPRTFYSWATFGVLIQILIVYFFAAVIKDHPAWLGDGRAVQYALMVEQLTRPLVVFLLPFDLLLRLATWGTMILEFCGPVLLLFGVGGTRLRMALVPLFMSLHLSFVVLMDIGQFPFISIVGWFLFIPREGFDAMAGIFPKERGSGIRIWYDGACGFCNKTVHLLRTFLVLDQAVIRPAQEDETAREILGTRNSWAVRTHEGRTLDRFAALAYLLRISPLTGRCIPARAPGWVGALGEAGYRWVARHRSLGAALLSPLRFRRMRWRLGALGQASALALLTYIVIWNLATISSANAFPAPWRIPGEILATEQRWRMFAPYPLQRSGQIYGIALLADSTEVLLAPDGRTPRAPAVLDPGDGSVSSRIFGREDEFVRRIRLTEVTAPTQRWRKYHENLARDAESALPYASFLCRDYSAHRGEGEPVLHVRVIYEYSVVQHEFPPRWSDRIRETLAEISCEPG